MEKNIIKVKQINGDIYMPGDKSISHRAAILGAIAEGVTEIKGFLMSEDCLATLRCLSSMGVQVKADRAVDCAKAKVKIVGKGLYGLKKPFTPLYVGNSGTTIRLLAGILAGQRFYTEITGDKSIIQRPMARIIMPLRKMGAQIWGLRQRDKAPLYIKGSKLRGIQYALPVPSAQIKSALLLAGLYADGITIIKESVRSRDHTEIMLRFFGADIKQKDDNITLNPSKRLCARKLNVPGDISLSAFFIVAALILDGSEIVIKSVGINPTRTGIIDILKAMGACIIIKNKTSINGEDVADICVRSSALRGIEIKPETIPRLIDELPVLAVAAAFAEGTTTVRGAQELRVKESDRIKAICEGLLRLGVDIQQTHDGFVVKGPNRLIGTRVRSFGDHRIAMALTVAGLAAEGQTVIDDISCVNISYPGFFENLFSKTV